MRFLLLALTLCNMSAYAVEIQNWKTDNGVPVLFIEAHDLPIVDLRMSFLAASSRDADLPGQAGLVNGLLVEGSGELTAQQIALQFEQVGARFGFETGRDMASTSLRSLSDREKLEAVIDLFARVTALPSFPQEALERDRGALLVNLAERQKRAGSVASDAFFRALYRGHPYEFGSRGKQETIKVIKREDIVAFHRRYYVAANASLAIVGDLTLTEAKIYANKISQYLPDGKMAEALPEPEEVYGSSIRIAFDTEQTQIKVGMPVMARHDPDFYVLTLGNHILGGNGSNSRLMQKIREERALTYGVYSYFLALESIGPFQLSLQTRNHQADEALRLLEQTLAEFIDKGPTQAELDHARKNITGGFALRLDSNRKLLSQLSVIGFYRLPLDYLDEYSSHINAITIDDIRRVFKKRIKPEKMIRVIVGPEADKS
jgi:zinc protease